MNFVEKEKEWRGIAVLSASETPLGSTKKAVAQALYSRLNAAVKELVLRVTNESPSFGGYAAYTAKFSVKLKTLRDDFITRRELARLILAQRDSVIGNREPSPEDIALWEAAETVSSEKGREKAA